MLDEELNDRTVAHMAFSIDNINSRYFSVLLKYDPGRHSTVPL